MLRAANRLFLRDGYVATSLASIAEEAALTKGAVYSNFASKEDLFLAVLQESGAPEWTAPHDVRAVSGASPGARARSFGRYAAGRRPSRQHVALFLEMNAAALRSKRARSWVRTNNASFFEQLGTQLEEALDAGEVDASVLGLVAQSLYAGLLMHGAFSDDIDEDTFAQAYEVLAALANGGEST